MIRDDATDHAGDLPGAVQARPYLKIPVHTVSVEELRAQADTVPLGRRNRSSAHGDTAPLPVLAAPVEPLVIAPPPPAQREHTVLKLSFAGFGLTLAVALIGVALSNASPTTPGVPQAAAPVATSSSAPPITTTTTSPPAPTTTPSPAHVATAEQPRAQRTHPPKPHRPKATKANPSDPRAKLQELLRTIQNYQRNPPRVPGWPPTR